MLRRLQRFFLTTVLGGLVVVLPITLLVMVVRLIFNFINKLLDPIEKLLWFSEYTKGWIIDLLSIVIIILVFFLLGLFVRTELGRKAVMRLEERFLNQLPFYKILRDTVQQFLGNKKMPFSKVVMVDAMNTKMVGFITTEPEWEDGYYTVFVPTAPNPTNGFVFHVKKEQLEFLKIKPEDAMRTIIGLGTGSEVLFKQEKNNP